MFVPFEKLPDSARIWVYQSDRKLTHDEQAKISTRLSVFTNQWTAHNQMLGASFSILYDQFIVLAVDEDIIHASGCSIDSSVRTIQELAKELQIDFFSRMNIAFLKNDRVTITPLPDLAKKLEEGIWSGDTLFFDNTILVKGDLTKKWIVRAEESWLKRYLVKSAAGRRS